MPRPSQVQTDIRTGGDAITLIGYKLDQVLVSRMPIAFITKISLENQATDIGAS